jgi:hypothetical protein
MKKITMTLLAAMIAVVSFAQADKMFKHTGETLEVKVVRVSDYSIIFKYPGEDAEQTIGKLAVEKIVYSSGRTEQVPEKVSVSGATDWEKVQVLEDKTQIIGLKKMDEIRGKTSGLLSFHTAGSADKKATKKLKEAAAEMGAPFILMTSDNDARAGLGGGVNQGIKKGFAYGYK